MDVKTLLSALVLLLAADSTLAQPPQPPLEGRTILAVRVSGLDHVKESVVLAQVESAPGQPYHKATADRDIVRLDRLGAFAAISLTPVAVDDGVRVDVTVTETSRMAAGIALAVTDENGTSAGPALKMTSIAGHPLDLGVITRFGGETLVAFQEISPQLTNRRLWHTASLSLSDRFNELEQFEQRSVDLDTRIGFRSSEQWRSGAIFKFYGVGSDVSGVTLSPDNHDSFKSIGGVTEYDNRDSFREPSHGWFNSVDALWTTGSGQYATLNVDVRRYQPVAMRQVIVATALVTVQSGSDGVDLPDLRRLRARRREYGPRPGIRHDARQESIHQHDRVPLHGGADAKLPRVRPQLVRRPCPRRLHRRRERLESPGRLLDGFIGGARHRRRLFQSRTST